MRTEQCWRCQVQVFWHSRGETDKKNKLRSRPFNGDNLDRSQKWYTWHGGWNVQTRLFGGVVEFWTSPDLRLGESAELNCIGIEGETQQGNVRYDLEVLHDALIRDS